MMADAIRAGRAWLPGEGRNHTPVVHIDDCVRGLMVAAEKAEIGGIVHVTSPSNPTLKELYAEVHKHAGGKPVRFWSTWIPSAIQNAVARHNESIQSRLGRKPRFTNDNLRLMTASVRLKVDRLEKEFGFAWAHPDFRAGIAASFGVA
jgi:nucleoside-diphosphate-sugar epimerase